MANDQHCFRRPPHRSADQLERLYTIKEAAELMGIKYWLILHAVNGGTSPLIGWETAGGVFGARTSKLSFRPAALSSVFAIRRARRAHARLRVAPLAD